MSSEVQTRQAGSRGGRGSARGGRGGFSGRGGARGQNRGAATNGDAKHDQDDLTAEDQGELGDLKKKHGSKTGLIKEMFPDWSEADILFALKESDGDENLTVTRIAEGEPEFRPRDAQFRPVAPCHPLPPQQYPEHRPCRSVPC